MAFSSALSTIGPSTSEASPADPGDLSAAFRFPVDSLPLGWTLPLLDGKIVDVPYRSQLDGSPQARANCGPASLSMVLARFGDGTSIADIRRSVNRFMGVWRFDNGATWEALAHAATTRGYQVVGLFAQKGSYRRWTIDDLAAEAVRGNAVVILVRYRALPGREGSDYPYNHYVVVVGVDPDGTIAYHDPAYPDAESGAFLRITSQQLAHAWSSVSSGIVFSGMVVRQRAKK